MPRLRTMSAPLPLPDARVMVSTDHLTLPASMDANCEVQVVEGDLPAHRLAFEDARKLAAQIAAPSSPLSTVLNAIGTRAASPW